MCGLFGFIAAPSARPHFGTHRADQRLLDLGRRAQARGPHSWGVAAQTGGEWKETVQLGRFSDYAHTRTAALVTGADLVIGHTRWATQGAITLANASPQRHGAIIGAHNGDIDRDSVPLLADDPCLGTDSAVLLRGLSLCLTDDDDVDVALAEKVLSGIRGRVAVVWSVTATPTRPAEVWLARGAHSPLTIGRSQDGRVWWGSEPWWLTRHCPRTLELDEGSIVRCRATPTRVEIHQVGAFVAQPRASDIARLHHHQALHY